MLEGLKQVDHVNILSSAPVELRIFARKNVAPADLAAALSEVALKEQWSLHELHAEEGRLDEVFRAITLPDTKSAGKENK
jgi:ABC-2 type transport system ATP-binding protein